MRKAKEARDKLGILYQPFTCWEVSESFDWQSMSKNERKEKKKDHIKHLDNMIERANAK